MIIMNSSNFPFAYALNVRGITAPLSGHWIPEEQPEFVIEQLATFFSKR
jgi:pimeloyl-ACP methyl ester carboxylesterase